MSRVAVVGHGPSCVGVGGEIDASDIVVRLADCGWQNAHDHGLRYDYGLLRDRRPRWDETDAAHAVGRLRLPDRGWWLYRHRRVRQVATYCGLDVDVAAADELERAAALPPGCRLTRGCVAVLWALRRLAPTRLDLWGFDSLAAGVVAGGYHPARGSRYRPEAMGAARYGVHSFAAERAAVLAAARLHGIVPYHAGAPMRPRPEATGPEC